METFDALIALSAAVITCEITPAQKKGIGNEKEMQKINKKIIELNWCAYDIK